MSTRTLKIPFDLSAPAAVTSRCTSIVHVPRRFVAEEWGGTETVVLKLCHQQLKAGCAPVIMTSTALSKRASESYEGVPVRRFSYCYPYFGLNTKSKESLDKKGGNLLSLPLFYALMKAKNVRLFHAHTLKRLGGMVATAARLRKKPFVVTLHGGVFDVPQNERESLIEPIKGKFEWGKPFGAVFGSRKVLDLADMIICVGERERENALLQLKHDRIVTLPNGVESTRFTKGNGPRFREQHGIPANAFMVLNVGRLDAQKNQLLLIEAFALLRKQVGSAQLVIIGPQTQAEYAAQLRNAVAVGGLQDSVRFIPGLAPDDDTLENAYHAADVFALPSRHEPFGISVLEAWCAGRAVVANNVGGLSSLVRDGETGLFINADNADPARQLCAKLALLARDEALRKRLGAAGRNEAVTKYDWSRINLQLELIYQQAEAHAARRYGKVRP